MSKTIYLLLMTLLAATLPNSVVADQAQPEHVEQAGTDNGDEAESESPAIAERESVAGIVLKTFYFAGTEITDEDPFELNLDDYRIIFSQQTFPEDFSIAEQPFRSGRHSIIQLSSTDADQQEHFVDVAVQGPFLKQFPLAIVERTASKSGRITRLDETLPNSLKVGDKVQLSWTENSNRLNATLQASRGPTKLLLIEFWVAKNAN